MQAAQPASSLHACITISNWAVVLLGVALPLLVLGRLERRDHKPDHRRRAQQAQEEEVEAWYGTQGSQAPASVLPAGQDGCWGMLCSWALELLLISCLSWRVASLAPVVLQFFSPAS